MKIILFLQSCLELVGGVALDTRSSSYALDVDGVGGIKITGIYKLPSWL